MPYDVFWSDFFILVYPLSSKLFSLYRNRSSGIDRMRNEKSQSEHAMSMEGK